MLNQQHFKNENIFKLLVFVASIILLSFSTIKHLLENLLNLQEVYDVGIYHRAIIEIAYGNSLNPFIGFRGETILNDHFDPILHLLSPVMRLFQYSPAGLFIIEFIFVSIPIAYLGITRFKNFSLWEYAFAISLILFSRGVLSALNWPVHPTTWSILPLFFLVKSVIDNNKRGILIFSLCLIMFKETYPFSTLLLSLFYYKSDKKLFSVLFSISAVALMFIFWVRPFFFGKPHFNHLQWANATFFEIVSRFGYKDFFKIIIPIVLPLFYAIKNIPKSNFRDFLRNPIWAIFLIYIPQLGIHFLAGKAYYHYGIPLGIPLVSYCIFNTSAFKQTNTFIKCLVIILAILPGIGTHKKNSKHLYELYNTFQQKYVEKNEENKIIARELRKLESGNSIYATSGLITRHQLPGINFYQLNLYAIPLQEYQYILMSKNDNENIYPYSDPFEILSIINCCKQTNHHIIYESNQYFFAKGPFPLKCFDPKG